MKVKVNEHTANTVTIGELRTGDFFKKENDNNIYIDVGISSYGRTIDKPSIRAFNINTGEPETLYFDEVVVKKYDAYITVEEIPLEEHTYH
jgi:hypothetical protein